MTTDEFNRAIEDIEITMLDMTPDDRFDVLVNLARDRHQLTGQVYTVTDLLAILRELNYDYLHFCLCRAICNLLYIHNN